MDLCSSSKQLYEEAFWDLLAQLPALIASGQSEAAAATVKSMRGDMRYICAWHDALRRTCTSASYHKAFKRLTSRELTIDDVIQYGDIKALCACDAGQTVLGIGTLYEIDDIDTACEAAIPLLKDMSLVSSGAVNTPVQPDLPSREQIQENIKQYRARSKAPDTAAPDISVARRMSIYEAIRAVHPSAALVDSTLEEIDRQVTEMDQTALQKGDVRAVAELPVLKALQLPAPTSQNTQQWQELAIALARSESLLQMTKSIPPAMMATIEKQASAIAGGVQQGTINMGDVDLAALGESVMSNCSKEDMTDLASNMDTLMPNLQNLTKTMGDGAVPDQMQQIMSKVATDALGKI